MGWPRDPYSIQGRQCRGLKDEPSLRRVAKNGGGTPDDNHRDAGIDLQMEHAGYFNHETQKKWLT